MQVEEVNALDNDNIAQLFRLCDSQGLGWLTIDDLSQIVPHLSRKEIEYIFEQLDQNGDGKVTETEFRNGFENVISTGEQNGFPSLKKRASIWTIGKKDSTDSTDYDGRNEERFTSVVEEESDDPKLDGLSCQDDVLALYEKLQAQGVPDLLNQFEKVLGGVFKELKEHKEQHETLQTVFKKEKEKLAEHVNFIEAELDQQLIETEEKVRREERERLEQEKEDMRRRLEGEISELHTNINKLRKMENVLQENDEKVQKVAEMRNRMHEMMEENRRLKNSLAEAQTQATLVKCEFAHARNEYEEKCLELVSEKETLIATIQEQENLNRQVHLLNDANKRLHDTNDNLRSALETRQAFCKKLNLRTPSPVLPNYNNGFNSRQDSITSLSSGHLPEFVNNPTNGRLLRPGHLQVNSAFRQISANQTSLSSLRSFDSDTHLDSGVATGLESELSTCALEEEEDDLSTELAHGHHRNLLPGHLSHQSRSAYEDTDSDDDKFFNPRQRGSICSNPDRRRRRKLSHTQAHQQRQQKPTPQLQPSDSLEATGPPDRTFRVVMAGDASVGKSSMIMRMCKGQFVGNLPSTLGVDFHVKTVHCDGKNVAIQLWDTAGQERFRSLCKSYFRRADGALLMYDVTCEQSFLSIRSWLDTIQDASLKPIPVLLCANKIDSRMEATSDGKRVISTEEGEKFAKLYPNVLFLELSAKEGTNVNQAVLDLSRELLASEDCEVKSTSLILSKTGKQKSACCGGSK